MKSGGLMEAIIELSHERGLEQESIIEAIEDAIVGAAYRKYKTYKNIEAAFNQQTGDIDLMHYKTVVEEVQDPDNEILLDEVIKLDPLAECGDEVEYEIDAADFKNVIAQTARQLIFQKIREAERESVMEKFSEKKGEIIHGTVARIERGRVILTVGTAVEAALEYREQIPFEKLQPGEHVRVLLIDLQSEGRGPQLIASRTHPDFLMKLFEVEVPEVFDGIIEVVAAAREPGKRAKVAVYTNDSDIDPVGACVGMRGSRVQSIVSELCGERIDVIEWAEGLEQFIANALAPADIMDIDLDEDEGVADIKIAQDQLSLAIGKQGQNVRLASKLTGIMINIIPWEPEELDKLMRSESETESTPDEPPAGETEEKPDEVSETATEATADADAAVPEIEVEESESTPDSTPDAETNAALEDESETVTVAETDSDEAAQDESEKPESTPDDPPAGEVEENSAEASETTTDATEVSTETPSDQSTIKVTDQEQQKSETNAPTDKESSAETE